VDIVFPAMAQDARGTFIKLGLRRAQAISLVNAAILLSIQDGRVGRASITLGSVAPTIIHASQAEDYLVGRTLDDATIQTAAMLVEQVARPISDVRSPADYRSEMVRVCTLRGLQSIRNGDERVDYPAHPILLRGRDEREKALSLDKSSIHQPGTPIVTRINGKPYTFTSGQDKTLLRLLREEAGLTGTKEGCAEGECGACTVFLDGVAVMSCLVPAPRAHGAEIVTVEGLAHEGVLHPVQQAFIDEGAVQCGYCTPGFLMSAAMLLEEKVDPSLEDIRQAITGNLCRCTGYYSIVSAIEKAALELRKSQAGREASYVEI
jgi:carbon-monoxide dehydrogenase medium subunit